MKTENQVKHQDRVDQGMICGIDSEYRSHMSLLLFLNIRSLTLRSCPFLIFENPFIRRVDKENEIFFVYEHFIVEAFLDKISRIVKR